VLRALSDKFLFPVRDHHDIVIVLAAKVNGPV
jgi:hypothetical protein